MPLHPRHSHTPVVLELPFAVASALGNPGRHLDPSNVITMVWGSFSPPQSNTSATVGAHSELAAGRSTAAEETEGFSPCRPPARELGAHEPSREEQTMD